MARPKAEIPTQTVSIRLRDDEAALLREACERMGVLPGRLLGRMIRAAFEPVTEGGLGAEGVAMVQHPRLPAVPMGPPARP